MEIKYKKIEDIKPYLNNPRFNDDAVEQVANSIREFGFKVPIILDKDNIIVAGHTRYKASMELGLKEVPVIVADDLTDEQIKAFRLADNKVSEQASWNYDLLVEELQDLDIDMSQYGFENFDIDPEELTTEFNLPSGDKTSLVNLVFSLSQEQADFIMEQLNIMKKRKEYKEYNYDQNNNSNGNSLFLIVKQWDQLKK